MNNKGFAETHTNIETPNDVDVAEKPLKTLKKRVDINNPVSYTHLRAHETS